MPLALRCRRQLILRIFAISAFLADASAWHLHIHDGFFYGQSISLIAQTCHNCSPPSHDTSAPHEHIGLNHTSYRHAFARRPRRQVPDMAESATLHELRYFGRDAPHTSPVALTVDMRRLASLLPHTPPPCITINFEVTISRARLMALHCRVGPSRRRWLSERAAEIVEIKVRCTHDDYVLLSFLPLCSQLPPTC